jgi:glucose/arabinose dehydrogenase
MVSARAVVASAALVLLSAAPLLAQLRATLVAGGFNRPLGLVQVPNDPTAQVVLEQGGRIRVLKDGALQATAFLDLTSQIASGGEQGLLGLAFAPNFASSGRVFVSFTNLSGHSVVARFVRASADPLRADPASRFDLVWPNGQAFIFQPFSNHNGGHIAFGPDGFLYFGLGDGGSGDDPMHLAQQPLSLLGKMLRLDVSVPASDPQGYDVPPSNPFVGRAGVLAEIWAFGLRNPWRWSFDTTRGGTGALVIGDVGQDAWEEIDYEPSGAGGRNYGWRIREGAHDNVTSLPPFSQPLRDPVWEYGRADGRSVTGGYVYRGTSLGASFVGRYFFADFVTSRVWSVALTIDANTREATAGNLVEHTADFASAAASPASFGVDAVGELDLVSYNGSVYRLEGSGVVTPPTTPPTTFPPGTPRLRTGPTVGTAVPRKSGGG